MRQHQTEEGILCVIATNVFVLHIATQYSLITGTAHLVHQVAQEGFIPTGRVFHVLILELEEERVDSVPMEGIRMIRK